MAQMFERDTAAFTEEFEPGLEPGIPGAPENPGTPAEAEVGINTEEAETPAAEAEAPAAEEGEADQA
jgi:hypothetical protein